MACQPGAATHNQKVFMTMKRVLLLSALFLLAACGKPANESAAQSEPVAAAPESSMETASCTPPDIDVGETAEIVPGVEATLLARGYGRRAVVGDTVSVHYTGWLYDPNAEEQKGGVFDSSRTRNQQFPFTLGANRVIPGWESGVECMLVGEKRLLKIAPEMAYGSRGAGGVIPPNATLLFEVELFSAKAPGE